MSRFKYLFLAALAGICFASATPRSHAQISISIGAAPVCPYGYFDYTPYDCAPYGYYGPEWFPGGIFVGAGPWFHGPRDFHGHVNSHFDPHHGYHGPMPHHGDRPEPSRHPERGEGFKGDEWHDGHGHSGHDHPEEHHEH